MNWPAAQNKYSVLLLPRAIAIRAQKEDDIGSKVKDHSCKEHEGALDIPRPDEASKASRLSSLRKERCIKY